MIKEARQNKGFRYVLTCIDVFSKYAWAVPIKRKTGELIVEGFKKIMQKRRPEHLQTDFGKEFYNAKAKRLFDDMGIVHYSTNSELKASVVERFNRTLKEKLEKIFEYNKSRKWVDLLEDVLRNYNHHTIHRTIGMTPAEASRKDNEAVVRERLVQTGMLDQAKPRFEIGDTVRIKKQKALFEKGYKQN